MCGIQSFRAPDGGIINVRDSCRQGACSRESSAATSTPEMPSTSPYIVSTMHIAFVIFLGIPRCSKDSSPVPVQAQCDHPIILVGGNKLHSYLACSNPRNPCLLFGMCHIGPPHSRVVMSCFHGNHMEVVLNLFAEFSFGVF